MSIVYLDELVEVKYKEETFPGYIKINDDRRQLVCHIDHTSKYFEELSDPQDDEEKFHFHCKLLQNKTISLFDCHLENTKEDISATPYYIKREMVFSISYYVDDYIESLEDLRIKKVSAVYPYLHSLFSGREKDLQFNTSFTFLEQKIHLRTEEIIKSKEDWFESTRRTQMKVTIENDEGLALETIEDFFFRFSTMASFLSNHFVTHDYYQVPTSHFWFNIDTGLNTMTKKHGSPKINKYHHRFYNCTNEEFHNNIIGPLLRDDFRLWMNYVSTLRFKEQLIEEKFLTYFRCMETLARQKAERNWKRDPDELQDLKEQVRKLMEENHFEQRDVEHVENQIPGGNNRNVKDVLYELVEKECDIEKLKAHDYFHDHKKFINNLAKLRHKLSHGNTIDYSRFDETIHDIFSLEEILVYLLLKEQGIEKNLPLHYYEFEKPVINVPEKNKEKKDEESE